MQLPPSDDRAYQASPKTVARYTITAQAFHWLTALLIFAILPVAWVMMSLPNGAEQDRMFIAHRSLGVTIFVVAVARLAWRVTHPAPAPLADAPQVTKLISQITHWLLYAFLLLTPVTGYLQSADGRPVSYLGLFNLPGLPKDKALGDAANTLHSLGQWGFYTLICLHVGATAWHVAIRRDGLLGRMIPRQNEGGSTPVAVQLGPRAASG